MLDASTESSVSLRILKVDGETEEAKMEGPSPHLQNERVELGVNWTPAPRAARVRDDWRRVMVCYGKELERERERAVERPPMPAPIMRISIPERLVEQVRGKT
ncbi:hypothetical protein ONS95_007088 [Cadophora gregata]|uniref:uncharacterized protein n=1 Tax=Cadophora gregata TaxID=51156 RepID=UPI0026DB511C|nr:uncharacterized protein ONS95_007088 [Cadophora gregata]KAK0100633.1 hypothetical protein ONS95_007088 [Cadophora gregata]